MITYRPGGGEPGVGLEVRLVHLIDVVAQESIATRGGHLVELLLELRVLGRLGDTANDAVILVRRLDSHVVETSV